MISRTLPACLSFVLVLALQGCCFVDHEQMASTAAERHQVLGQLEQFPDEELSPALFREVVLAERDAWAIQHARLTGAPISSAVRTRVGAGK